jgi:hypothetical protein
MSKLPAGSKQTDPNRPAETHIIQTVAADCFSIAVKKEGHDQLFTSKNIEPLALL